MIQIAARKLPRLVAVALATAIPLAAFAASGEFTFVVGEVTVTKTNGQQVTPKKGTPVDPGDRIVTGANGMAQLTMVDEARLSLRPSTQFVIENYPDKRDSDTGGVLNLIKGTLRTFTGLIASNNRDKFVMKTRVATVGIRGSGNILYACEQPECDESVTGEAKGEGSLTVNHTIEGSHAVTNIATAPTGTPAQQGGATTLITGPGQTVLVAGNQPPRYIPTPRFIADVAVNMTNSKVTDSAAPGSGAADTRNYAPSDNQSLPASQRINTPLVGNNGLGFPTIDASTNLNNDPQALRDVTIAFGSPFFAQSTTSSIVLQGGGLRQYDVYGGGTTVVIEGGTQVEGSTINVNGALITYGRYNNAALGFNGSGSGTDIPGSIHWISAPSGYPGYLSDVLTGTASYTLVGATSPTNQNGVTGTLGSMTLGVNFTNRVLDFDASLSVGGGSWNMSAQNVPLSLNQFSGDTGGHLVITNSTGASSASDSHLSGSFQGGLAGTGLGAATVGYGVTDTTSTNPANWQIIGGVAALGTSTPQDGAAPFREGRVSDPNGSLSDFIMTYATTNRPTEVTSDTNGHVTAFVAPYQPQGSRANYAIGSAQVVDAGVDVETGMVWGRWSGGVATITGTTGTTQLDLHQRSLAYIFAGTQSGPVALPLTGTAIYDVIGNTSPTDAAGHVGTLNTAQLNANFTDHTVSANVNIAINGQTWNGQANNMPIYRDQYFGAFTGSPIPGVSNPAPLILSCTPSCGANATGSFDGFFTGRNGQRAGLMYNMGGNQGAVAFGQRGPGT